jgi:hypothetical protein
MENFKRVITDFLENLKAENYEPHVEDFSIPTKSLDVKCHRNLILWTHILTSFRQI